MIRDYCVMTQWKSEDLACAMLRRQGFHPVYPVIFTEAKVRGKLEMRRRGLFPRYIFLPLDLEDSKWRVVKNTFGVHRLLGAYPPPVPKHTPGRWQAGVLPTSRLGELTMPYALPDGFVAHVMSQERVTSGTPAVPSLANKTVRVTQGPFSGFEGIASFSDGERVKMLLSLFGRDVQMTMRREDVELVEAQQEK
jgi:transcription antitermination factor NusG